MLVQFRARPWAYKLCLRVVVGLRALSDACPNKSNVGISLNSLRFGES